MSLAIVPGSFDPMTLGHLDVVRYAAEHYDEVVVAVMINPSKSYLFDLETRVRIAELTVSDDPKVRVISDSGMLVDLFDRFNAQAVCKGWRNQTDYEYEMVQDAWNREHNPKFHTDLIHAKEEHVGLSSTEVRKQLENGEVPQGLVHPHALPLILKKLKKETLS